MNAPLCILSGPAESGVIFRRASASFRRLLVLAVLLGILPTTTRSQTTSPTGAAPAAGATTAVTEEVTAAKVVEEGDADSKRALEQYRAAIERFDATRASVAEALFRVGEISQAQNAPDEARRAFERITREFSDLQDVATRAQQRLEVDDENAQTSTFPMSHELMKRYGLLPSQAKRGTQSAAAGGSVPPAAKAQMERYAPSAETTDSPVTFKMDPQLMKRYGLVAPAASNASPAQTVDRRKEAEIQEVERRVAELRSEAGQLGAQLREVRREVRATENTTNLDLIPIRMIKDPGLLRLLSELETARLAESRAKSGEERDEFVRALNRQRESAEKYFADIYLPRLGRTSELLESELRRLTEEIDFATALAKKLAE